MALALIQFNDVMLIWRLAYLPAVHLLAQVCSASIEIHECANSNKFRLVSLLKLKNK